MTANKTNRIIKIKITILQLSFARLKDYYAILDIPVSASVIEIKKAYRKMAMIYHPDKHNNDPYLISRFDDVKEAYETLINPYKKDIYLQQRWLYKAQAQSIGEETITPPNILKQALELNKAVAQMDIHRMNHVAIISNIKNLINADVMGKLVAFDEQEINQTILHTLVRAMRILPLQQAVELCDYLSPLVKNDPAGQEALSQLLQYKQKQKRKELLQPFIIFLLVLIICFLIWISGKK